MGDGKRHNGDVDGDWDAVEIEVDARSLDDLDAEIDDAFGHLDGAFAPIDTPAPSDSTRMPAQRTLPPPSALAPPSGKPPTPLPPTARPPAPTPALAISRVSSCPTCGGPVDVKSRHVAVSGGAVRVYCSQHCRDDRDAPRAEPVTIPIPKKRSRARWIWWSAATLFVGAGCATAFYLSRELREMREEPLVPPAPALAVTHAVADPTPSVAGNPQADADAALTRELMHDRWIHPLAGPMRRMPVNHNGAFGAERAGERPPECVSGHCGVDVGRVWGEHVYAVHDGVIEWVNRGPNDEHGGIFVRIAHRDGTLFSWYFHLAAVPRWVKPGVKVSAGQVIGLLGDTGIKHSAPHLHFSLSVRTSKHAYERYLDPEPLIAIWPLWIPNESGTGGSLATDQEPGVPVRASGGKRHARDPGPAPAPAVVPAAAAAPLPMPATESATGVAP